MLGRKCPTCNSTISQSWYVFSAWDEKYRCVKCSTLLSWRDIRYWLLILIIASILLLYKYIGNLIGNTTLSLTFLIFIYYIINLLLPSKLLVKIDEEQN